MLWWRGLRSRPLVDLLLVLLSTAAVATAVLGPLLVRAIEQSTVVDTVVVAGPDNTSMTVFANGDFNDDRAVLDGQTSTPLNSVRAGPSGRLWAPLQQWTESTDNVAWKDSATSRQGELQSRVRKATNCKDLVLTSGRCPDNRRQTLVSDDDAASQSVGVGSALEVRVFNQQYQTTLTVVGTYDPRRVMTPLTRAGTETGLTSVATADPLIVTSQQLTDLPLPTQVSARLVLAGTVVLADEPLLRQALDQLGDAVLAQQASLVVDTRLPDVLDRIDSQSRAARVIVGVVEVQALGLALFAVAIVLARLARARSAEWGAGRLLGVPRTRWWASVYVEPALALLLGVPLGYGVGVLVGRVAVRVGLTTGTPFEPLRWPVWTAAIAAGVVALVVLVGVSLPSLRRPLAELVSERSEAVGVTPLGAVAQAGVLLLAAGTVYVLLSGTVLGGSGPRLGLLAPALFALALAVLGIRVATSLVRRRAARPARSLVGLVVARQAARTPSSLSPAVVVTVGVALVVFAGQVLALSVHNQELKADATTGAASVLQLAAPRGTDLLAAVDAADPTGRLAMAARERAAGAEGPDRIVAVDTRRLAAVSTWLPRWAGVDDVAAALRPATGDPITLTGTTIVVRLGSVEIDPAAPLTATKGPAEPELGVIVDTGSRWRTVDLGTVRGRDRLTAKIPCEQGCRLVALGLSSGALQPYAAKLTIAGLGTDVDPPQVPASDLTEPGRWHARVGGYYAPDPDARSTTEAGPDGLVATFVDNQGGAFPSVAPSDVLDPLPVLVGPATQPSAFGPGTTYGTGLDGNPQLLAPAGHASVLPRALDDGVLVDLRAAQDLVDEQNDSATPEVWLAPGAPTSIESSLTAAGFVVVGRESLADTRSALVHEPTTRAASVAQTVALTAVLLTLLALVAARVADAPRRRTDWRSLADAGVRAGTLRRLATVEIAVPAALGVVLGTAGGVIAIALSASRLPLVDLTTPGPPLDLALAWPRALLVGAAAAGAVVVVALVAAAVETDQVAAS